MAASFSSPAPTPESQSVIRWGAVFGGSLVAVALTLMFYAMGLGMGFASLRPEGSTSLSALGFMSGTYGLLVPLAALFIGAYFASRSAGTTTNAAGLAHGLPVWGLSTVASVWLFSSLIGGAINGTFAMTGSLMQAGGSVASSLGSGLGELGSGLGGFGEQVREVLPSAEAAKALTRRFDVDVDGLIAPINQKLEQLKKPPVRPEQIKEASAELTHRAMRDGKLDVEMLTKVIGEKTSLRKEDAQKVAAGIEEQFNAAYAQVQEASDKAREQLAAAKKQSAAKLTEMAQASAVAMSKAFFSIFSALLMGLFAAAAGSVVGVSRDEL